MRTFPKTHALALILFSTLWLGSAAAQPPAPEPVCYSDQVYYLSGGVGADEAQAMKQSSRHYPLTLLFAESAKPNAVYAAELEVTITNPRGRTVLKALSVGPYLLVKLPPGSYLIDAVYSGNRKQRKVTVKPGGHTHSVFVWPAGTGST